tara:strand:- start:105 stop:269 length:165 start_codon:yes stop_codon:yes gene_type:complete
LNGAQRPHFFAELATSQLFPVPPFGDRDLYHGILASDQQAGEADVICCAEIQQV